MWRRGVLEAWVILGPRRCRAAARAMRVAGPPEQRALHHGGLALPTRALPRGGQQVPRASFKGHGGVLNTNRWRRQTREARLVTRVEMHRLANRDFTVATCAPRLEIRTLEHRPWCWAAQAWCSLVIVATVTVAGVVVRCRPRTTTKRVNHVVSHFVAPCKNPRVRGAQSPGRKPGRRARGGRFTPTNQPRSCPPRW